MEFVQLTEDNIHEKWRELKELSADLKWDYWEKENFVINKNAKWLLSFYCIEGKDIIGYCIASEKEELVWLHHVIVSKAMRRKGVGTILINELESRILKLTNKNKLGLKVKNNNVMALNFYLNKGFSIESEEDDYIVMIKKIKSNKNVVAIHQPNYIPWSGYFYKIHMSDIFVFLDDVQYTKNSFINRNRIKGSNGVQWLTIPINSKFGQNINEIALFDTKWTNVHMKTLDACYKKAMYYEKYREELFDLYRDNYDNLCMLNIAFIKKISYWIGLSCEFYLSSEASARGSADDRLIDIVKWCNGRTYLSGKGGKNYQSESKFSDAGIQLKYYDFTPPEYPQVWGEFVEGLSIIDLLFNNGDTSKEILINAHKPESEVSHNE